MPIQYFPLRLSSETVLAFLLQSDVSLSRSLPDVCELPLLRTIYCLVCIPFKTHITYYFAFSCYDVVTIPLPCWKLRFCQKVPLTRHSDNPEQPLSTSGRAHVARNFLPWRYFLGWQNNWSIALLQAPTQQCSQNPVTGLAFQSHNLFLTQLFMFTQTHTHTLTHTHTPWPSGVPASARHWCSMFISNKGIALDIALDHLPPQSEFRLDIFIHKQLSLVMVTSIHQT